MIVLISRGYVTRRARPAWALAAVAAGTLIAGCGGGSAPPANTVAAAPTPVVSGAGVQDQGVTGGSSSGGNGPAAGTISKAGLGNVSSGRTGNISHSSSTTFSVSRSVSTHVSQNTQIMSPAQAKKAQQQAAQSQQQVNTVTAPAGNSPTTSAPATTTAQNPPSTGTSVPPVTRTKVVFVTRTRVLTVYRNRTITKTITKTVAPSVPAGAFLPSTHPELGQRLFTVTGANVGCVLAATGVRCGITHKAWTAPAQPKSCKSTWGSTLALATHGLPKFSCGGSDPVNPGAKVIPAGWDTTVGDFTCQIRSFGVNCFDAKSRSGFMISRTGYSVY